MDFQGRLLSVVVEKLQHAGHQVSGLAQSFVSTAALESLGIDVVHGDLDSLEILVEASRKADAVPTSDQLAGKFRRISSGAFQATACFMFRRAG